eukprot:CAMPEP_0170453734 /NCGR_PEP_ID=MMETSP0123-20130129/2227_1 /TAXON_ID=182087 /ORGANISM="Favella ehrenbergii, Strain Fehren 1" /LENGTH=111 /DNA_ID=CAMNT_0010716225 /DNA_START=1993 /DNA_END=2328 /DNA_ORIENTATION=+
MGGLKGARSRNFTRLFKLRINTSHHAEGRDVRQARQNLRDTLSLHLESLKRPVARADGVLETFSDLGHIEEAKGVEGDPLCLLLPVGQLSQLSLDHLLEGELKELELVFEE